jgi:hypothetical protein
MKKILIIIFLSILHVTSAQSFSSFGMFTGKGDLKIPKDGYTFDILEFYFSAGGYGNIKNNPKQDWQKKMIKGPIWKGQFIILSKNASGLYWYYSQGSRQDFSPNYLGKAIQKCKEQGHGDCFVFAIKNKIVWQNGINPKKGTTIKRKDARKGFLSEKLKDLGFLDNYITKKKTKPKITKKKEIRKTTGENKSDIVSQIKDLKELLDAGIITQDEFVKAKKKLLN